MQNFNDSKYITRILKGDTKAFEVLVNHYKNMVYSIALKMVQNKEEAEEVAQDSFIKIFKSISNFKGESKFSTWLYRITYNTCLDNLKKNKKHKYTYQLDEITSNQLFDDEDSFDKLVKEDQQKWLKNNINKLKKEDQLLLTLYYYEELSLQEISEIMNKNYNQIRTNLFRSRKKLAILLTNNSSELEKKRV